MRWSRLKTKPSLKFEAIGTQWQIEGKGISPKVASLISQRIAQFDKTYSRFRADSLVTQMSQRGGEYELPPDGEKLLSFYKSLYEATNGKVTPLIGNTLQQAGYDAHYSLKAGEVHAPLSWDEALDYSFPKLVIKSR